MRRFGRCGLVGGSLSLVAGFESKKDSPTSNLPISCFEDATSQVLTSTAVLTCSKCLPAGWAHASGTTRQDKLLLLCVTLVMGSHHSNREAADGVGIFRIRRIWCIISQ